MNAKRLTDSVGVQTPAEKPEPPADVTDFLKVIYRASAGINPGANSAGRI